MDVPVKVLSSEGSLDEGETKGGIARIAGQYSDFLIRVAEYAFITAREQAGYCYAVRA